MSWWEMVSKLMMADLTKDEVKSLSGAGVKIGWRSAIAIHIACSYGLLQTFGLSGFALASDVESKVSAAVKPLEQKVDQLSQIITRQLLESTAAQIRDAERRKCRATSDGERDRLQNEIDRLQDDYNRMRGSAYPVPDCRGLLGQ